MAMWNPWRGCHKYSEGCRSCYIHKGDAKCGVDTEQVVRTDSFAAPLAETKKGDYKIMSALNSGSAGRISSRTERHTR